MEIPQKVFDEKLKELAEGNWKIKNLLRDCGGFNGLPEHLQTKIYEMLKIKKQSVLLTTD